MKQLSLIEIAFFLKKISIFEESDLDFLVSIADEMNQDVYDKNEKIFDINQKPIKMYFIAKGSVNLLNKKNEIIKNIKKYFFFGDEDLFTESLRSYKSVCKKESLILTITKKKLFTIISEAPLVAIKLLEIYAKNIDFDKK